MIEKKDKLEERIPFTDDLIFALVMRDPEICKGLLERILPEVQFSEIRIEPNESLDLLEGFLSVEQQKSLKFGIDVHGVRFDAYAKAEKMWADIEMQTYTKTHIGRRSRYYHANMDMDFLEQGKSYDKLKPAYVIFICTYDYMGKDEAIYFFQNYDVKNQLSFGDLSYTIVLNTSCSKDKVPEPLQALFEYINNPQKEIQDELMQKIDERVRQYNTPDWRRKQMTLAHLMEQERNEERDRLNELTKLLLEANRIEDLKRAVEDKAYQEQLLKEYNL